MSEDRKIVDLIGDQELKASETVEVRQFTCAMLRFNLNLNLELFLLTELGVDHGRWSVFETWTSNRGLFLEQVISYFMCREFVSIFSSVGV